MIDMHGLTEQQARKEWDRISEAARAEMIGHSLRQDIRDKIQNGSDNEFRKAAEGTVDLSQIHRWLAKSRVGGMPSIVDD